jgi:hypothetical protein
LIKTEAKAETEKARTDREQEVIAAAKFDDDFDSNWAKACRYYPELNDKNSPMYKAMQAIDAEGKELGDPHYNSAEKPWVYAKEAAKRTGTVMTKPEVSPPKKKAKTSPVQPAGGNARTTSAPPQKAETEIAGLDSEEAYDAYVSKLLGKNR